MTSAHEDQQDPIVRWRGINHLALVTNDMDATVRFYHGVLGARLIATIGTPYFRHYFFEIGPQNSVAFFEYARSASSAFSKPAGIPDPRAAQFDHLSFNVADEDALLALARAIEERPLRGHRRRRPRLHPLGLFQRSERNRARGLVVGTRRHGSGQRLRRRPAFRRRGPRAGSCRVGPRRPAAVGPLDDAHARISLHGRPGVAQRGRRPLDIVDGLWQGLPLRGKL